MIAASSALMRLRRGKDLERAAQQADVGNDLDENVGECTETAEHQDDPEPVGVGPPAHEMNDGKRLQDHAVWIKEPEHIGGQTITNAWAIRIAAECVQSLGA